MSNKKSTGNFILTIAAIALFIVFLLSFIMDNSTDTKLTSTQKTNLIVYAKYDIVDNIKSLGCESAVADFMNSGKWEDRWCAERYSHIFEVSGTSVTVKR